jgi:hypothetical protein
MGKNLEYLIRHIPHISNRLVKNIDDLIASSEMVVLCHFNRKIVDVCKTNNSKLLLDLTGKLKKEALSNNIKSLILHD